MEASRLVFVSVKNAKPRRKVAVPIPDGYTWDQFCQQIQTKLKLRGVGSVFLVSSGERVTTLDELQDIDELHVVEAVPPPSPPASSSSPSPDRISSGAKASTSAYGSGAADLPSPKARNQQRHSSASPPGNSGAADDTEAAEKYGRRPGGVRRSLQRLLPGLFAPTLPVTQRDAQEDGRRDSRGRRRRRRGSFFAAANLARLAGLLLFLLALFFLYSRMVPRLE